MFAWKYYRLSQNLKKNANNIGLYIVNTITNQIPKYLISILINKEENFTKH